MIRDGTYDRPALAKDENLDAKAQMGVRQEDFPQLVSRQLFGDHVFWQTASTEAGHQQLLLHVQVVDIPSPLALLDADFAIQKPGGLTSFTGTPRS
ncbi:hypothetical protein [Limimaricola cinnabarinus]|uniref:Uncharacterized protein n=1 Tax=Limimaricola cinnabarinus LL-001 TaxID=1337093 RepID=U2YPY0_9RHOB|nr:hypothetical protein [Limimaricola cinnabarinus]GAD57461.1 hypothetical protein MBELCI_3513 [Limimaricola cinnabarinus LL-001]